MRADHQRRDFIKVCAMIEKAPELNTNQGFGMVLNWLSSGEKPSSSRTATALMMPSDKLVDVLSYLRRTFPSLERCTTYARSRTLSRKSQDELIAIREAGLDRLHVGLETGDDVLLKKIKKGVTGEDHVDGGRKAIKAGFQLSEY